MPPLGFEYLTSNQHTAYPFKEDAPGLRRGDNGSAGGIVPMDLLLDAVIYLSPSITGGYSKVYLYRIHREFDPASQFELTLSGPGGVTDILCVIPFQLGTGPILGVQTASGITVRLLKGSFDAFANELTPGTGMDFGTTLPFEDCVVQPRTHKLDGLLVCDSVGIPKPDQPLDGMRDRVRLQCGYNVSIGQAIISGSDETDLSLNVVPADGEGIAPISALPPRPVLNKAPMGLIPDRFGRVRVVGDDCYEITASGVIQIHGNCYACCTCDQYVAIAKALKAVIARADILKAKLLEVGSLKEQYEAAVKQYNTVYSPEHRKMYGAAKVIRGVAPQDGHQFAGSQHTSISVRLLNRSDEKYKDVNLKLETTPAVTILNATYTKGQQTVAGSLEPLMSIGTLLTTEGVAATWYMTTGSPTNPVTHIKVTAVYQAIDGEHTDVIYDGPPECST